MKLLDKISQFIGHSVAWLTLLMVIFSMLNIMSSWLLKTNSIAIQESITWMHGFNFLLAMAYTLNKGSHVRVDIFYAKMSLRKKALVDFSGTLLMLLPTALFIAWASWPAFSLSWRVAEVSSEPGGLPAIYILKALLLLMPLLLILEACNQLIKNYKTLFYGLVNEKTI